jgi:tRNA pseudouridine55 synthase
LARAGKEVIIEPRMTTINRLEIVDYTYPYVKQVADVSSGTYIRTLVEDIGATLGTGAYTCELRRTKVGDYTLEKAISVQDATSEVLLRNLTAFV